MKETRQPSDLSPAERRAVLAEMLRARAAASPSVYPASHIQRGLWFIQALAPDNPVYNVAFPARVHSRIDKEALNRACQILVQRHASLRTTFERREGELVQIIAPHRVLDLDFVDAFAWSEEHLRAQAIANLQRPFDLEHGPLLRISLYTQSPTRHLLVVVGHHIILDAWSLYLLLDELRVLYPALVEGRRTVLPPIAREYTDFVRWEKDMLASDTGEKLWAFWKQKLAGDLPLLNLPLDHARPTESSRHGASHRLELSPALTRQLKVRAREEGVTLYMMLVATYQVLLYRYTGQKDILIGTPVSGRTQPEFADVLGCFVNMFVLRTDLSGNPSFRELLSKVRRSVLEALAHQDYPLRLLVEKLRPNWDQNRTAFFQSEFALQKPHRFNELANIMTAPEGGKEQRIDFGGLELGYYPMPIAEGLSNLSIEMMEGDETIAGSIKYNPDILDPSTIARIAVHYQTLLQSVADNPEVSVSTAELLSKQELGQVLIAWNKTQSAFPTEHGVAQLFEAQVEQNPNNVAAICENAQLTYRELNTRANGWAQFLVERGVGPDFFVAILADRGLDFLTAILATLKAGGAYVPLDPAHPAERIRRILAESQPCVVIVSEAYLPLLRQASSEGKSAPEIATLTELGSLEHVAENLPARTLPHNLAYVIYTSGSTGTPKGAMLEQLGMVNHLFAKIRDAEITHGAIVAQSASQCFDISVWQFLSALVVGGTTYIFPDDIAHDPAHLLDQIEAQRVNVIQFVPSLLRYLLEEIRARGENRPKLSALHRLVCAGEALPPESCRRWLEFYPQIPILNAYGPTECNIDATHYLLYEPPAPEVIHMPIGRPINNMSIFILDKNMQVLPIGVPGELHIGGIGVGRGYLGRPDLTREKFIPNPFVAGQGDTANPVPFSFGDRLYKTGDLARYLPDGNIEFLGRLDFQVKVRGFRIELGEIETVLAQHPAIRGQLVMAREEASGDKRLVAYVIARPSQASSVGELRLWLQERLPDYMVPSAFIFLEAFPLTSNGKVNRAALPAPESALSDSQTGYIAPRTELEETIAQIWQELLGRQKIGMFDDFFEIGGHSLMATQVVSRMRQTFGIEMPLSRFLQARNICDLARYVQTVSALHQDGSKPIPVADREETEL